MQFNSFAFLGFFAVLSGLYYLLPGRFRWVLLLVASYWFYSQFQLTYVLLLAYSTLVAYAVGLALQRRPGKGLMWLGVVLELAVLVLFKYVDFFSGLLESADALAALDVARWRPEVADRLMDLRRREPLVAPPGTPERCVALAARALTALEVVDLALEDDGGALSLHEITRREAAILPLARTARRALVAACSPEVWPPA